MSLENFKCFSEKVIVGPFSNFNAIVGPNGTGKSTILEAIQFLFASDLVLGVRYDFKVIKSSNSTKN